MSDDYNKIKYTKYSNTSIQQNTITNGYCSIKYNNKIITSKSKNQLKTRDTIKCNYRKKNYNKFQNKLENNLDYAIEQNDILIESNKRKLLTINEFLNTNVDNTNEWVIC